MTDTSTHHTREGIVPWPAETAARYRRHGFWQDRTLGELLWETADSRPEQVALVDAEMRLTYAEVTDRADAAAGRLIDLGLQPDDRILVQMPNGWEFVGGHPGLPQRRRHSGDGASGSPPSRADAPRQRG